MLKNSLKRLAIIAALLSLSACASWSHASTKKYGDGASAQTMAENIIISKQDINKPYTSLGDITATVNKTTVFNADPTPELVNEKLKKEAAKLGADAVILVRYGNVGVSAFSWGSLEGKGRAIKFK